MRFKLPYDCTGNDLNMKSGIELGDVKTCLFACEIFVLLIASIALVLCAAMDPYF